MNESQFSKRGWPSSIALLSFFVIFPGFFAYHALVGKGYMSAFLGGYSTGAAALVLPLLAVAYVNHILRYGRAFSRIEWMFLAFILVFATVVGIGYAMGADQAIVRRHIGLIIQFLALAITARLLEYRDKRVRWLFLVSFVLLSAIIFLHVSEGAFAIATLGIRAPDEDVAGYQSYAFVYLVVAMLCAATSQVRALRLLIYLVAIPALFLNGARSEFVGFLIVVVVVEFCFTRHRLLFLSLAFLMLIATPPLVTQLTAYYPDSRILALAELAADDSAIERTRVFDQAWQTLGANPLLGRYGHYAPGEYAHNLLSAWTDLGLIGFLLFCALLMLPTFALLKNIRRHGREPEYVAALACMSCAIVLLLFAKNFAYPIFPIALALYGRFWVNRRLSVSHQRKAFVVASPL